MQRGGFDSRVVHKQHLKTEIMAKNHSKTGPDRQLDRLMRAALGSIIHTQATVKAMLEQAEDIMTEAELADHEAYRALCSYDAESGKAFRALCDATKREEDINVNSIPGCYPRLVDLKDVPQEYRQKISDLYGIPLEDMTAGGKRFQGKETHSDVSAAAHAHRKDGRKECHSHGKGCRSTCENPSLRIKTRAKNGNTPCQPQYLERAYEVHCVFHRISRTPALSRNRFYEAVRRSPWFQEQNS